MNKMGTIEQRCWRNLVEELIDVQRGLSGEVGPDEAASLAAVPYAAIERDTRKKGPENYKPNGGNE